MNRPLTSRYRSLLLVICLIYLLLGLRYALVTPPLEASDEYKHYPVVQYLQTTGRLVVLDPQEPGKWLQEGAQPPLYYAVMAAVTSWIDTGDLEEVHQINHHAYVGNPNQIFNKNLIVHDPGREAFPWQGTILAVYIIRFVSLAFGLVTLLLTARMGTALFSPQIGLLAAALTAVNPMFLFVNTAVNNDSLSILLGTAGIYLLVRLWQDLAQTEELTWMQLPFRRYLFLGLICGLALLTKLSLAGLLLLAGLVTGLQAWRKRAPGILFGGGVVILLTALLVSGWWIWRNMTIYGDPTGLNAFVAVQGTRDNPTLWGVDWPAEFGTFFRSYWGLFGGVNIAPPQWFYLLYNLLFVVGLGGLLLRPAGRTDPPLAAGGWLPALWTGVLLVLLLRWNIISPAFQGRLIFPALGAINSFWAAGLWRGLNRLFSRKQLFAALALVGGLALLAAFVSFYISRAYAYPTPVALPPAAAFGPYRFVDSAGSELWLVGVELSPDPAEAGEDFQAAEVALYWQLPQATDARLLTAVDLLGKDLVSIGRVNRYPGWGMWPTDRWRPGEIYRDAYKVVAAADAVTPVLAHLRVGAANLELDQPEMIAFAPDETQLPWVLVGEVRVEDGAAPPFEPAVTLDAPFAEGITLRGYTFTHAPAEEAAELTLFWEADSVPAADYTVFVQLLDEQNELLGSGDAPPLNNDLPTGWWRPGDRIVDPHTLNPTAPIQPGLYRLAVGLYDPQTGVRVPLLAGGDAVIWEQTWP